MSTLLADELWGDVELRQNFKIKRNLSVAAIRPWIYKQGVIPAGTFELSILEGSTVLKSSIIAADEINSNIPSTYAHGSLSFEFENLVLHIPETEEEKEYTIRLTTTVPRDGFNFLAVCRRWEAKTYPTYGLDVINNEAPNDSVEPYGLELYEFTTRK